MSEQTSNGLLELVELIADNKYVLGDRLAKIGISAPTLESALSAIAIAQGELGHARVMYNWSFELSGIKGMKPDVKEQTGRAFPGLLHIHNWITLVAGLYLFNLAAELVLTKIFQERYSDSVNRLHKLLIELEGHKQFAENWVKILLNDGGSIPLKMNQAMDELLPQLVEWLTDLHLLEDAQLSDQFLKQMLAIRSESDKAYVG